MRCQKLLKTFMCFCMLASFTGCFNKKEKQSEEESKSYTIEDLLLPSADGFLTKEDDKVLVDYSNTSQGYIMAETKTENHKRIKVMLVKDDEKYTYDLNKENEYEVYPLNMGDGEYTIKVYENMHDDEYVLLFSFETDVELENELLPSLYPNQVVDYDENTLCIQKSFDIVKNDKTNKERVKDIYNWVIKNIKYDWDKLDEIKKEYTLPNLDDIYENKKAICFDYAAIVTAMLRAQHIPTKLLTGTIDDGYHAWIEVYDEDDGWVKVDDDCVSGEWKTMDPTYDALNEKYEGEYKIIYSY